MTVTIHLGVIDLSYSNAPGKRQKKATAGTVTTGQVAEWLEEKYHILEIYSTLHASDIARDLEEGVLGALESIVMGAPVRLDPFATGLSKIERGMKEFISNREMDSLGYPGVPTQAAKDRAAGVLRSGRKKKKRASNAEPVSFYDTGLYQSAMKAWVD